MQIAVLDRAPEVAEFLDIEARCLSEKAIIATIRQRWPDLSREEYLRALDIAIELGQVALTERRMALPR